MTFAPFLPNRHPRSVTFLEGAGLAAGELYIGPGNLGLEVVVGQTAARPAAGTLQAARKARRSGRPTPVLMVARYRDGAEEKAGLCGATGDDPPVYLDMDAGQAARLCDSALAEPDRHAALRFLAQALPSLETPLPGLRNEGFLALHELTRGVPRRSDWSEAAAKARGTLGKQGFDLLSALGFKAERLDNLTQLLRASDKRAALAVLLEQSESPEAGAARFNNLSPVSYALNRRNGNAGRRSSSLAF